MIELEAGFPVSGSPPPMKRRFLALLFLVSGFALRAQSSEPNLDFAFEQLKTNGAAPFAKVLYEDNSEEARQLTKHLAPMIESSGEYLGYEILSRRSIGRRLERLVLVAYFAKRPIFLRMDLYESSSTKLCLSTLISREASELLPFDIISATGR